MRTYLDGSRFSAFCPSFESSGVMGSTNRAGLLDLIPSTRAWPGGPCSPSRLARRERVERVSDHASPFCCGCTSLLAGLSVVLDCLRDCTSLLETASNLAGAAVSVETIFSLLD